DGFGGEDDNLHAVPLIPISNPNLSRQQATTATTLAGEQGQQQLSTPPWYENIETSCGLKIKAVRASSATKSPHQIVATVVPTKDVQLL
ncbi:hypothetical protein Pfo_003596, partial [Paulownia fortunei]